MFLFRKCALLFALILLCACPLFAARKGDVSNSQNGFPNAVLGQGSPKAMVQSVPPVLTVGTANDPFMATVTQWHWCKESPHFTLQNTAQCENSNDTILVVKLILPTKVAQISRLSSVWIGQVFASARFVSCDVFGGVTQCSDVPADANPVPTADGNKTRWEFPASATNTSQFALFISQSDLQPTMAAANFLITAEDNAGNAFSVGGLQVTQAAAATNTSAATATTISAPSSVSLDTSRSPGTASLTANSTCSIS